MKNKLQGFTLIELVMVIVILGILGAVALPKFANLRESAVIASLHTGRGAAVAALTIVHSQAVVEGKESALAETIILEETTIDIKYGYPDDASELMTAAGLKYPDFLAGGNNVIKVNLDGSARGRFFTDCSFSYVIASSATSPAKVLPVRTNSFNMDTFAFDGDPACTR